MRLGRLWAMAAIAIVAVSARADDAVLLRYKWVAGQQLAWVSTHTQTGTITLTGSQGRQVQAGTSTNTRTVFVRVEKVTPEGLAYLKVSFGLVITDRDDPKNGKLHIEMNPVDGTMVVEHGDNRNTMHHDLTAGELDLKGFTAVVDDRGQVKQVLGNGDLLKLVAGLPNKDEVLRRVARSALDGVPLLPEKPVKPGDEWQQDALGSVGGGFLDYSPDAKPARATFRYKGEEKVGDVVCRRIGMRFDDPNVDMLTPAKLNDGVETEVHLAGVRASGDLYLSEEDGTVWQANMSVTRGLKVHVQGKRQTPKGEQKIDVTATCDEATGVSEVKRL